MTIQAKELGTKLNTLNSLSTNILGVYNIKNFGAKGDGVTDDTDAFKAAMTAIPAGGELRIPEGKYIISDTIVRTEPITIYGSGSRGLGAPTANEYGTIIQMVQGETNKNVFEFGYRNSSDHNGTNLSGLSINGGATTGDEFNIVTFYNLHRHINIVDCFFRSSTGAGYRILADIGGYTPASNVYFYSSVAENCKTGFYISNGYNLNILNCYAGFGMENGFRITSTNQVKINNCWTLSGITSRAIFIENGNIRTASIINNFITDAGSAGIYLGRPYDGGIVANNVIYDTAAASLNVPNYGIQLGADPQHVLIHDNVFNNYNTAPIYVATGADVRIYNNFDGKSNKFSSNEGNGTILDGNTSVTITHNIASKLAANINIQITPSANESIWVTGITDTQFTANRAGTTGDLSFNWAGKGKIEMTP